MLCFSGRALGTPNNEMWPDVESLQDYKNTFPKWKPSSLASHVKNLDEDGLDLLSVSESRLLLLSGQNMLGNLLVLPTG